MTCIRTILLMLACATVSMAQTYTYSVGTGSRPFIAELRPNAQLVYPPPKEDELSTWQTLPFGWNFFGRPVSGFFISDNGYITFDSLAATSEPVNNAIPGPASPNDAIYAFWDDLHLSPGAPAWSNEVRTLLWGTAPNRVLVIMWIGVVPKGVEWSSSNNVSFAIALFENGDFDIIFVAGRHTVPMSGTIGVEDLNGLRGSMVPGSPELTYPSVTADPNDDVSYRFTYSSHQTDAAVIGCSLPPSTIVNKQLTMTCTVKNMGMRPLNAFHLNYSVDGGSTWTDSIDGLNLQSNETYDFTHATSYTPAEAGRFHRFRFWASDLNSGDPDTNPANDTLHHDLFVQLGTTADKHVLVEEFTGAWCGWCPDGGLQMQHIEAVEKKAMLVSIHAGGTDSMIVTEGAEIANSFNPAYPQAMIDRVKFPGQAGVPINRSNNAWLQRVTERLSIPTPLSIAIHGSYEAASRAITADITIAFNDYPYPGDLRLHLFVIEDRVTGTGRGYDQANYYSRNSSYPNHPYYSESNPIVGYVHRHVLRAVPTGTWGDPIPPPHAPGSPFSKRYTVTLPTWNNESEVRLVAFVSYFDADIGKRDVLNAVDTDLLESSDVARLRDDSFTVGEISPNPVRNILRLPLHLTRPASARIVITDAIGHAVSFITDDFSEAGPELLSIPVAHLRSGLYFVRIQLGSSVAVRRFVLIR